MIVNKYNGRKYRLPPKICAYKVELKRHPIAWLWSKLTKTKRYIPVFEWSRRSWIHNIFRFFEMVFGRKEGIRCEMVTTYDSKTRKAVHKAFTFEAHCALLEQRIRALAKIRLRVEVRVLEPVFSGLPSIFRFPQYKFAVALDTTVSGGQGTASYSHTTTGSNMIMIVFESDNQAGMTSITYNGTNLTKEGQFTNTPAGIVSGGWYLIAPATGSNTVSLTLNGGGGAYASCSMTYSGVAQSGFPDSRNTGSSAANVSSLAISTTVVASNCWLVGMAGGDATSSLTLTTDLTSRQTCNFSGANDFIRVVDSNATVSTGSNTMNITLGGGTQRSCWGFLYSISPVTTVDYTLACAQGSYTLTGQTLNMTKALSLALAQGSYTLTGFAAGLGKGYTLLMSMGSYALTGFDANFTKSLIISCVQGAYTLTGQTLTMTIAILFTGIETGYYTLTGFAIFLLGWIKRVKPLIGDWTKHTKPGIGSYTKHTKPSIGTYTKRTKPTH